MIGGGVLGLEAAWELKKAGLHVEVLEAAPVLMGRQLDAGSAKLLQEIAEKNDVKIHTGVSIEAIEGDGCVTGVRLADGTVYPAELVIVSAGVRANVKLAQEIGLEVERAVIVNERMRQIFREFMHAETVHSIRESIMQSGRKQWKKEKLQEQMLQEKKRNISRFQLRLHSME